MALHTWLIYLVAATGLCLTPGPNVLLALTHGALHGHRKAIYTILGGSLGFTLAIGLSLVGISAILQAYAGALLILKFVGGAYLIWLGSQLWRSPGLNLNVEVNTTDNRGSTLFRQGFLSAVANPKVLLFYGAFLPQFIDPERDLLTQFIIIAVTFAFIEFWVEYGLARLAHQIRPWLERVGKQFNRVCGTLFMGLGAALPITR